MRMYVAHPVGVGVDDVGKLSARSQDRLDRFGQPGPSGELQSAGDKET